MTLTRTVNLRELVESKLSEFDLYRYMIGNDFRFNTVMKSPLRPNEKNPSFSIGASSSGRLIWRDYAADKKGGAIDLVREVYGLDYWQALAKVAKDFYLLQQDNVQYRKIVSQYEQPVIEKHDTVIHVKAGKWSRKALAYWSDYGIGLEQLQKEDIHVVEEWYLQRKRQVIKDGENVYAYRYTGDRFKIYMPQRTREEGRWKNNITCDLVENLENLNGSPKVLITKSKKDRIVLQQIVPYTVLSVQNEGISAWTDEFRKRIEGKEVIICYDSDEPGVRNCKKICDTYGYRYVNTPKALLEQKVKDPSDWYKAVGSNEPLKEFLRKKEVI